MRRPRRQYVEGPAQEPFSTARRVGGLGRSLPRTSGRWGRAPARDHVMGRPRSMVTCSARRAARARRHRRRPAARTTTRFRRTRLRSPRAGVTTRPAKRSARRTPAVSLVVVLPYHTSRSCRCSGASRPCTRRARRVSIGALARPARATTRACSGSCGDPVASAVSRTYAGSTGRRRSPWRRPRAEPRSRAVHVRADRCGVWNGPVPPSRSRLR